MKRANVAWTTDLNQNLCLAIQKLLREQQRSVKWLARGLWADQSRTVYRRVSGEVAWTVPELSCVAELLGTTVLQLVKSAERIQRDKLRGAA